MKAKHIVWGILGIIALVVFGYGMVFLFRPASIIEKVTDPNRAIYTYEWFFNTKASAQSLASQVVIADKAVETFKSDHVTNLESYANSTELARLRAVSQGLRSQLVSTVNSYNANAQNKTRSIFKDWNLPGSLSVSADGRLIEN